MTERKTIDMKSGAPPCGLYLRWSENRPVTDMIATLRPVFRVMNASDYERNMHMVEWAAGESDPEDLKAFAAFCAYNGVVFVLRDQIGAGVACGAQGVVLDDLSSLPAAREAFGEDGLLGLRCADSRKRAQEALAAGADFVTFFAPKDALPAPSLAAWWSTQSDAPCVMEGPITNDDCAHYVKNGAGFIEATSYVLSHPAGVMQGTVNMLYAIDLAAESQGKN